MPVLTLLLALASASTAATVARTDLSAARSWACFYGANLSTRTWTALDLAIVDPDNFRVPESTGPVRLAYVSAGEADERRAFWPKARGKSWLIETNPDWAGAFRVDIRAPEWRKLLLGTVIPEALAKGYQGVMFDTLDTADYFESSAPARFAGSRQAAVDLVLAMRAQHPKALILVNNGLPLLERLGSAIDGVLVEDLYSRCLPNETCRPSETALRDDKERALLSFAQKTGRPVFVLIYARLSQRKERWVRLAVARARALGFLPYVTDAALERLGEVDP